MFHPRVAASAAATTRLAVNGIRITSSSSSTSSVALNFVKQRNFTVSTSSSSQVTLTQSGRNSSFSSSSCNASTSSLLRSTSSTFSRYLLSSPLTRSFASYPDHILLTMPALSPTMEKGNLSSWKKQVGDHIKVGEAMADVETDKATVAFEAVEEGYLAKILMPEGSQDVVVGTPVAVLAENKEDIEKFKDFGGGEGGKKEEKPTEAATKSDAAGEKAESAAPEADAPTPKPAAPAGSTTAESSSSGSSSGGRIVASPAARRIAGEKGVSLEGIRGTGPEGRILSADVHEQGASASQTKASSASAAKPAASSAPSAPASGDFTDLPHSNIRKVIAQRLTQSKSTIPHYYLSIESSVDKLMKIRAELNAKAEKDAGKDSGAVKLSVNDFLIKAAALACRKVPAVNSSWMDNAIRQYNYVDISVAVSTDTGLVTPIIKDADIKGLSTISTDTKTLASKARSNKLSPAEYQGGTFTISNLGMFGVTNFSAIINPPQAAILAVGTTVPRVVENGGQYSTQQVLTVTLSCDHRVVDGAVGAQWLQAFKNYIENPITMLL